MDSVFPKPYDDNIQAVAEGVAIVIDGDMAPKAITSGQYLFIKNHSTLATGGYHATDDIASGGTVSSSNVAADADGVVNAAYSALNSKFTWQFVNEAYGNTDINLPSGWHELSVMCRFGRNDGLQTQCTKVHVIPSDALISLCAGSGGIESQVYLYDSASKIKLSYFGVGGTDFTSTSKIYVYAR